MRNGNGKLVQPALGEREKIPPTIVFRLDEDHKMLLSERARALKMSVHDLARQYVIQMLHEADERQQMVSAVLALKDQIKEAFEARTLREADIGAQSSA